MSTTEATFEDPRTQVANPRRHGIHLRARLNECIVTLNLTWARAWDGDDFDSARLFAGEEPFHLQNLTRRLLDLLHARGRDDREDELIELMLPRARLLHLAAIDLSGPFVSDEPLVELAQRVDHDLEQLIGRRPSRSSSYQAACIHARRSVTYNDLQRDHDQYEVLQMAAAARDHALAELAVAIEGSAAIRDWARKDPAFRHLLGDGEFRRLLEPPSVPTPTTPPPTRGL
jgi:hypothetical protein